MFRSLVIVAAFTAVSLGLSAQVFPDSLKNSYRLDDHFWKRRVMLKVMFDEKINRALLGSSGPGAQSYQEIYRDENIYRDNTTSYGETITYNNSFNQGIVRGLLEAYLGSKRIGGGVVVGYDPLTPKGEGYKPLKPEDFFKALKGQVRNLEIPKDSGAVTPEPDPLGEDELLGDFDFGGDLDLGGLEETAATATNPTAPAADVTDVTYDGIEKTDPNVIPNQLEIGLYIVEDRIFDQVRSIMYYDIKYIMIAFDEDKDGNPDNPIVIYKWDDQTKAALEKTLIPNPQNDSQYISAREYLESRLFLGFIINYGGQEVRIRDGERLRGKMIEFEHQLWSY